MKPIKVGVLGLGTVGGGTVNILKRNAAEIARRAGREIIITRASARDLHKPRICDTQDLQVTTDPFEIINDPDIDIIVETIGGAGIVKDMILTAIANGKHIVTANKSLIATQGNEIFAKASEKGVIVAFEAAVAGGIPIIKAIREGLSGNQIQWLAGIINGTGNFILTEMRDKGRDFGDVLAEAQFLGYAEADPTFDVEGIDAAHKLTILASIAFGIPLQFEKVFTEGITQITRTDVEYAEQLGYRIKHLGIARKTPEGIELRVHPTLIPERRLIANVNGVMNAVLVKGDAVGATLYYGAGAGAEPTGSSIVADVIDVVRALTSDPENRVPHLAFQADALADIPVLPADRIKTSYYLRLNAEDKPGVLADVTKILADHNISIEAMIQKEPLKGETAVPIIMLTQITLEQEMNAAISEIEALPTVSGKVSRIRMETLG
ncbi:MAG: homoserine dehydrogenase [Methylovulum sp.]|uniref:homoserine dehydrogenase n=1 Tax=Methylovulum sp. TaxID=1916980 RepID=UPI00260A7FA9|nr:homoserine dehydrogenase [Methylovulum sp.]MDD2723394.1 homoserine dehydrogenase [Methylovulum sp.]MDD5125071.1 homoserine dehydrogenase [Methylovulum sp.]